MAKEYEYMDLRTNDCPFITRRVLVGEAVEPELTLGERVEEIMRQIASQCMAESSKNILPVSEQPPLAGNK